MALADYDPQRDKRFSGTNVHVLAFSSKHRHPEIA